jgi:hypothetical protein
VELRRALDVTGITTCPTLETTLLRAQGGTGLVLTNSSGTVCLKAEASGDCSVPNTLTTGTLNADTMILAGTSVAQLIQARELTIRAVAPLIKTSAGAEVQLALDPSEPLVAPSFQSGVFKLQSTDGSVLRVLRGAETMAQFRYDSASGSLGSSLSVNRIQSNGDENVSFGDAILAGGGIKCDTWRPVDNPGLTVEGDLFVNGHLHYNSITSPFWVAGKVDGSNLAILSSKGQRPFTVQRESGFGSGVFKISFEAHPDGQHYVIQITSLFSLNYLTPAPFADNGSSNFTLTLKTNNNSGLVDDEFHFTVLR